MADQIAKLLYGEKTVELKLPLSIPSLEMKPLNGLPDPKTVVVPERPYVVGKIG